MIYPPWSGRILGTMAVMCAMVAAMELPAAAKTLIVNQAHTNADDTGPGTEEKPFKTISAAARQAESGDTVLVHKGVYRERVAPEHGGREGRPVVYRAAAGEEVVIKGSDIFRPDWRPVPGHKNVYIGKFDGIDFGQYNPYKQVHSHFSNRTCGQVFIDGQRIPEVDSIEQVYSSPGTWAATAERDGVCVHFPPSDRTLEQRLVELTVRGRVFAPVTRGLDHLHVKGFVLEHCGNNYHHNFFSASSTTPQAGALGCRGGRFWVIEYNTIRLAKAVGIDCGDEGHCDLDGLDQPMCNNPGRHLIRYNVITDNGAAGIVGMKSLGTRIVGNRIEGNNYLGTNYPETAGVKMHFFVNGLIEGNLFRDNEAFGVWLDNVYQNARITRNVFLNNKRAAVFIEMGGPPGVLIDNNVMAYTRGGGTGAGLASHDAGGITAVHNLFFGNSTHGVFLDKIGNRNYYIYPPDMDSWQEWIGSGMCAPSHLHVENNLIIGNNRPALNMPGPGPDAVQNTCDFNVYISEEMERQRQFVANNAGGTSEHKLMEAMNQAYDRNHIPRDQRKSVLPYENGVLLDLFQWQTLTGFDLHSRTAKCEKLILSSQEPYFDIKVLDEADLKIGCKHIAGVDKDLLGNPIPEDNLLPGPFQNLVKGRHRIVLWPVPVE